MVTSLLFNSMCIITRYDGSHHIPQPSCHCHLQIMDQSEDMAESSEQVADPQPQRQSDNDDRITIIVSGTRFVTTRQTLRRFPNTRLGKLAAQSPLQDGHISHEYSNLTQDTTYGQEIFYDADDDVFREVLRYYRTGELHAPTNICHHTFHKQLGFWGIEPEYIDDCCQDSQPDSSELEKQFRWFETTIIPQGPVLRWSEHVWYFLTDPRGPYTRFRTCATAWTFLYVLVTVCQTLNMATFTVGEYRQAQMLGNVTLAQSFAGLFTSPCRSLNRKLALKTSFTIGGKFEDVTFLFFFIEIIMRVLCCPRKKELCSSWSINTLDMLVTLVELCSLVLLRGLIIFDCMPTDKHVCLFVTSFLLSTALIIQLRCVRLLAFATVFR